MWSVILEGRPSREDLQGFGFALGVVGGGVSAGFTSLLGVSVGVAAAVGITITAVTVYAAWKGPNRFDGVYNLWNRVAKAYARRARTVTIAVCFFTIIAAAGLTGGALDLRLRPEGGTDSRWTGRTTVSPEEYPGQGRGLRSARSGSLGDLSTWATRSGNGWTLFLMPFLALVSAFDIRDNVAAPDGIYTLY